MANYPQLDDQVGVWKLKDVNSAVMGGYWRNGGSRAVFGGGDNDGAKNIIDFITITSTGNAADFGDLSVARYETGCVGNFTRSLWGGGTGVSNVIDYVNPTTTGNAADFGNLTVARHKTNLGASNSIRALFAGGETPSRSDVIDYITMSSTGNAIDFGNLLAANSGVAGASSPTRAIWMGGTAPSTTNVIQFVEINTTGNTVDFGDLATATQNSSCSSSSTRAVLNGGYAGGAVSTLTFITMASQGNSNDFGDKTEASDSCGGTSNSVRAITAGGGTSTVIDFYNISNGGTALDFGDLTVGRATPNATSTAHGGLSDGYQGTRPTHSAGAGRGLLGGGKTNPAGTNQIGIQSIQIQTLGNTNDFGDLTLASYGRSGCASRTRGVFGGGYKDASPADEINVIESIEFASQGNAADFGNSTVARAFSASNAGSQTRGIIGAGGNAPGLSDVIDYITIASAGNATDFGNLGAARSQFSGSSSPTRAVFFGGLE